LVTRAALLRHATFLLFPDSAHAPSTQLLVLAEHVPVVVVYIGGGFVSVGLLQY